MGKAWNGEAQCLVKQNLTCCRGQQVVATHNLIDVHEGVIDDDSELIREDTIGAVHDEVANRMLHMLLDGSHYSIIEVDYTVIIDAKT